jgi:HNH endonuclease/AP2 domain
MLTVERLRQVLDYDPEIGVFTWRVQPNNRVKAGAVAGTLADRGYRRIKIDDREYLAHRLAWLHHYCEWPPGEIDHKDNNPANNAIANLRVASRSQNCWNSRKRKDNKSGLKGVYWHSPARRWSAQIKIHGRNVYLGSFATPEQAHAAYMAAAEEHFGEFARTA